MDLAVKIFQITFYLTASVIAILTFIKAKNGLLNSVNTEYQKKVMERLSTLSEELWEEFDLSSDKHWSKDDALKEILERTHEFAIKNKHEILTGKIEFEGIPVPKKQMEILALKEKLKSDPFIPNEIREKIIDILDNRISSLFEAYHSIIAGYQNDLIDGKYWDTMETNSSWIHNKINSVMNKNGAGIPDLESAAHEVRLEIQRYYDDFNPLKN